MRKVLCLACLAAPLLAGCAMPAAQTSTGWRFEIVRPPVVTTTIPSLVQSGSPSLGVHSMGALAGPLGTSTSAEFAGPPIAAQAPLLGPPRSVRIAQPMPRGEPFPDPACTLDDVCRKLDAIAAKLNASKP